MLDPEGDVRLLAVPSQFALMFALFPYYPVVRREHEGAKDVGLSMFPTSRAKELLSVSRPHDRNYLLAL